MAKEKRGRRPRARGGHLTALIWSEIVDAFRLEPGKFAAVGRIVGIDYRTAKRAWEGTLPYDFAKVPIREIVARAEIEARALRGHVADPEAPPPPVAPSGAAALPPETRTKAAADAIASRAEEGRMVASARQSVTRLLAACSGLVVSADQLVELVRGAVQTAVESTADSGKVPVTMIEPGIKALKDIAQTQRALAETAHKVLEMERLLLGDPGLAANAEADLSWSEALEEVTAAKQILDRAQARGLRLVKGGGAESKAASS